MDITITSIILATIAIYFTGILISTNVFRLIYKAKKIDNPDSFAKEHKEYYEFGGKHYTWDQQFKSLKKYAQEKESEFVFGAVGITIVWPVYLFFIAICRVSSLIFSSIFWICTRPADLLMAFMKRQGFSTIYDNE